MYVPLRVFGQLRLCDYGSLTSAVIEYWGARTVSLIAKPSFHTRVLPLSLRQAIAESYLHRARVNQQRHKSILEELRESALAVRPEGLLLVIQGLLPSFEILLCEMQFDRCLLRVRTPDDLVLQLLDPGA